MRLSDEIKRTLLTFVLLAGPWISVLGILLIILSNESHLMNAFGYIQPGGTCEPVCTEDNYGNLTCQAVGTINVLFYAQIKCDQVSTTTVPSNNPMKISQLIDVPELCQNQSTEIGLCCQTLMQEQQAIRLLVECPSKQTDLYKIKRVGLTRTYLTGQTYKIPGLILFFGGMIAFIIGLIIAIVPHCVCFRRPNDYVEIIN